VQEVVALSSQAVEGHGGAVLSKGSSYLEMQELLQISLKRVLHASTQVERPRYPIQNSAMSS
jgi:hypothetical protein